MNEEIRQILVEIVEATREIDGGTAFLTEEEGKRLQELGKRAKCLLSEGRKRLEPAER